MFIEVLLWCDVDVTETNNSNHVNTITSLIAVKQMVTTCSKKEDTLAIFYWKNLNFIYSVDIIFQIIRINFNRTEPSCYRTNFSNASSAEQNIAFSYIILCFTYTRGMILCLNIFYFNLIRYTYKYIQVTECKRIRIGLSYSHWWAHCDKTCIQCLQPGEVQSIRLSYRGWLECRDLELPVTSVMIILLAFS